MHAADGKYQTFTQPSLISSTSPLRQVGWVSRRRSNWCRVSEQHLRRESFVRVGVCCKLLTKPGAESGNQEAHTAFRTLGPSSLQSRHDAQSLYFFGTRREHLAGKHVATDPDVKQAVTYWLQALDTDFSHAGIQILMSRWDNCINVSGDYVGVRCLPSGTCVPSIRRSGMKLSALGCFTLLLKLLCVLTYLLISFKGTYMLNRDVTVLGRHTCNMSKH